MSSARVLAPPRTVDPYYHQAERMAEMERRLALLEQGDLTTFNEVGAGSPLPAFQNSFTNYHTAWSRGGYWKVGNRVFIQGMLFSTLATANGATGTIFTLPPGFRPAKNKLYTCWSNSSASRVDVYPDGTIVNQSTGGYAVGATTGGAFYLSLDGLSFPIGG